MIEYWTTFFIKIWLKSKQKIIEEFDEDAL
jgi:hypothetical protein